MALRFSRLAVTALGVLFTASAAGAQQMPTQPQLIVGTYEGTSIAVDPNTFYSGFICVGGTFSGGTCQGGQMVSAVNLAAVWAIKSGQSLTRLESAISALAKSVDSNTEAAKATNTSIDKAVTQANQRLFDSITAKFDALPSQLMASPQFKDIIKKLKDDILAEVKKPQPNPRQ
jgi:hypothetical protein